MRWRRGGTLRSGMPRTVAMLTAAGFFVAVGFGVMVPVLPVFARTFGVSNLEIGLVVSAFAAVRLLTSPFCGRIAGLLTHRVTIGAGILGVGVSSVFMGLSHGYLDLLFWRAIGGVGSAMFTVSAFAMLMASVPHHLRGRASGLYQGGFLLGGMAGPAIGGALTTISLTAPFFFYAGTLLVAGIVALTQLPAAPVESSPEVAAGEPVVHRFRDVLADPGYQAACLLNLGQGWQSFGVRNSLVPLLVVGALHRDPSWTGIAFAIAAVAQTAALYPIGRATDQVGRRSMMVLGGLVSGLATLAIPLAPDLWALVGILCVYGVGAAALGTAPTAAVGDATRGAGSTPIAVFSMTSDIGAIIGPLVAGLLADRVGMTGAFSVGAVILLCGAAWATRLPRTPRRSPDEPQAVA